MKQYRITFLIVTVVVLALVAARMTWRVNELEKQLAANKSVPADVPSKLEPKTPATQPLGGQKTVVSTSHSVVQQNKASQVALKPNVVPAKSPLNSDMTKLLSDARAAMGRKAYDKARESLRVAYSTSRDPDMRMTIGQMLYECLIRTHAYEEAQALGFELLTLSPSPEERFLLNQQLAALLHSMGKPLEAESLLAQAIATEQNSDMRHKYEAKLRGVWRHTPGRTGEVVSNLTDRVTTNPQDEATLKQLGDIYLKSRRDYKAAQPIYEQLVALHPDDPQLQSALLGIYRETKNFEGMRRVLENLLAQAGGDDPTLRFQIAQNELQAGRGDEAVAYAEKHLSGGNASTFQLQMLSTIYDKAGRKENALATLDSAIARETNAQQQLSMRFQKTDMLILNKQYTEAEKLLRSIIQTAGEDKQTTSRSKSGIIRIYEMQGKLTELNL